MDFNSLNTLLQTFWTSEKIGKHPDMPNQHGMLLMKNLKTSPDELFKFLETNNFRFGEFDIISWSEFYKRSGLATYLKPEFISDALKVTTTRPAIGKGEFLLVASFNNIGFNKNKGDLIDLKTGEKIEVKGVRATISGDGKKYKMMSNSVITSVFSVYNTSDTLSYFNRDCAERLETYIKESNNDINKLIEVLVRLQNVDKNYESKSIAQKFAKLYNTSKPNLFNVVGAMQLYIYLNDISYLMMVNEIGFKCFKNTHNPIDLLNIIEKNKIKLSSWETGTQGMEISI